MRHLEPLARLHIYVVLACFIVSLSAFAQVQNGQISGVISDPSGAVVPHASVHIRNLANGYEADFESDGSGIYTAPELIVGSYTVRVRVPGFKTVTATNLFLNAGTVLRVDFTLVGARSETVEVSDAARLVNTENSHLSYTVDDEQIANLPLNGRNVYDLIQYQPGATNVRGIIFETGANTVVNGVRENFNGFLINGMSNTSLSGGPVNTPILDTVQEVQVLTLNNSAEYGSSAGAITNLVSKSGNNRLHGSAWEFIRNEAFDANPFFSNHTPDLADRKRLPVRLNQFGATLGGPLKKGKVFFFASYQREKFLTSNPGPAFLESPEFRAATISAFPNSVSALLYSKFAPKDEGTPIVTLRDYVGGFGTKFATFADYLCPHNTDGLTATPGAMSSKFASLFGVEQADIDQMNISCLGGSPYTVPSSGAFNRDSNFLESVISPNQFQADGNLFDGHEASLRLDYNLSQNNRFFSEFNWARSGDKYAGNTVRGFTNPFTFTRPNFQISFIHTFSPALLNEFRGGYLFDGGVGTVPLPGVPGVVPHDVIMGFGNRPTAGAVIRETTYNYSDLVSFTHRKHSLRAGAELRRNYENSDAGSGRPIYDFFDSLFFAIDAPFSQFVGVDPGFTTGSPAQLAASFRHWRYWDVGVFLEDDWRISRRLTLNLGLRYDLYTRSTELSQQATTFLLGPGHDFVDDITTGAGKIKDASERPCPGDPKALLAGECGPGGFAAAKNLGKGDHNNFGPRLGFAWDVFGNGKTSVRGGLGISYEGSLQRRLTITRFNPPYYSMNREFNFLTGDTNSNLVYGPVDGSQATFLGPAPPAQRSGIGAQATGNISGWDPANPQTSGLTAIILQEGLRDPFVENWFAGAQRELRGKLILEVNYVGTLGRNLFRADNKNRLPGGRLPEGSCVTDNLGRRLCSQINTSTAANRLKINPAGRLNPNFGALRVWENTASSSYHSLQLSAKKQLSHGLEFDGNYTYSHSIDSDSTWQSAGFTVDGTAAGDAFTTDQTRPGLDRGNSVFDIRHRLAFTYVWEMPFFRNQHGVIPAILGGWQWNGIWSVQSGAHWSAFDPRQPDLQGDNCGAPEPSSCTNEGGDYNLDGESNDRPNAIANNVHATHAQWADGFNLPENFFSPPCLGCVGNLRRNTFVGPSYWDFDTSLFKNLPISDRFRLQFRVEAFNVFNHTNFLIGNNTGLHDPLFGQAGGTNPPRNLQFGLKLTF
jgi:outer membrane receptor protein involved in Fe transport